MLNRRIDSFNYGPSESSNKPTPLKTSSHEICIKQSGTYTFYCTDTFCSFLAASQTWCLVRFLPFLIADLIPKEDDCWEHNLLLMTITDYIFAPATTKGIVVYLKMSIEDFITKFRRLYPDRRITPLFTPCSFLHAKEINLVFRYTIIYVTRSDNKGHNYSQKTQVSRSQLSTRLITWRLSGDFGTLSWP